MLLLFILAALAYGAASLAYGVSSEARPSKAPRVALAVAAALHLSTIGSQCVDGMHPFKSIFLATSLGLLVTVAGYLLLSLTWRPMRALGAVLAPLGLIGLTVGVVMGPGASDDPHTAVALVRAHIAAATLGLAGFSLAAGVAGLYLAMERRLRTKVFRPNRSGISLAGLDKLHVWLVLVVTPIFTIAIATGGAALVGQGASEMLQARALELISAGVAWLASMTVLVARAVWGFRGRRAAWLTIISFVCVVVIVVWYGVRG
jgi:ABC-type uncharacterized transport system permease subunit